MKDLLRNHLIKINLLPFLRQFKNAVKVDRFNLHLKKYIFLNLRQKIDTADKNDKLNKLFKIPPKLFRRILLPKLRLWNDNAKKIRDNEAANKIQKFLRSQNKRAKDRKMKDALERNL